MERSLNRSILKLTRWTLEVILNTKSVVELSNLNRPIIMEPNHRSLGTHKRVTKDLHRPGRQRTTHHRTLFLGWSFGLHTPLWPKTLNLTRNVQHVSLRTAQIRECSIGSGGKDTETYLASMQAAISVW